MSNDLTVELINHIQGLSQAGTLVSGSNHNKVLIPNSMSLESVEKMNKYRDRFRGHMKTMSFDSFFGYSNNFNSKENPAICFIRSTSPIANTIFDIGDLEKPGHCLHQSSLSLEKTADYSKLLNIDCQSMNQQNLAEFMEDYAHIMQAQNGDSDMEMKEAILAVRNITFDANIKSEHEVNQLSTSTSMLEKIAATSKGKPIPTWLHFKCIPYHGLNERTFSLRLSLGADKHEGVRLTLRIANLEGEQEEIQEEFKDIVESGLSSDIDVYIGTFD